MRLVWDTMARRVRNDDYVQLRNVPRLNAEEGGIPSRSFSRSIGLARVGRACLGHDTFPTSGFANTAPHHKTGQDTCLLHTHQIY
jgi:hypothetical protein